MWPSECNGFQINSKYAAYLLSGSSGQIGVVELNKPGRLSDSTINSLINKSKVSDFSWDPFDDEVLAAACDDCTIRVWRIPTGGLNCSLEEPVMQLRGHTERLYCIKFHPFVKDVLATASYDRTIRLWDISSQNCVKTLVGQTDTVSVRIFYNWANFLFYDADNNRFSTCVGVHVGPSWRLYRKTDTYACMNHWLAIRQV